MFVTRANDPLPYRPIKIIDVSPIRSSIRTKRTRPGSSRRVHAGIAGIVAGALALMAFVVSAGASPDGSRAAGEVRLGPGHAMPGSLVQH